MASRKISYLAGDMLKITHFPSGYGALGGGFPFLSPPLSFDFVVASEWRVRTWKVTGSASFQTNDTPPFVFDFVFDYKVTFSDNTGFGIAADELAIINTAGSPTASVSYLRSREFGAAIVFDDSSVFSGGSSLVNNLTQGPETDPVIYDNSGGLYLFAEALFFQGLNLVGGGYAGVVDPPRSVNKLTIPFTWTVDPVLVPPVVFATSVIASTDYLVGPLVSGSGSMLLQAFEFWPFKNRAGQPVYDTATGAQINDPFG